MSNNPKKRRSTRLNQKYGSQSPPVLEKTDEDWKAEIELLKKTHEKNMEKENLKIKE